MILDALAIIFWPLIGLTALMYFLIRKPEYRTAFAVLAGSTLVFPLLFSLNLFSNESMAFVLDVEVGFVALGAFFLCMSWRTARLPDPALLDQPPTFRLRRQSLKEQAAVLFSILIYALLGAGLVGYGAWCLIGDYLVPRHVVEGRIEDLHVQSNGRLPPSLIVRIGEEDYKAPRRTFDNLSVGESIRAEIGRGSGYLFRVETLQR
jgi:hypothetical protein